MSKTRRILMMTWIKAGYEGKFTIVFKYFSVVSLMLVTFRIRKFIREQEWYYLTLILFALGFCIVMIIYVFIRLLRAKHEREKKDKLLAAMIIKLRMADRYSTAAAEELRTTVSSSSLKNQGPDTPLNEGKESLISEGSIGWESTIGSVSTTDFEPNC